MALPSATDVNAPLDVLMYTLQGSQPFEATTQKGLGLHGRPLSLLSVHVQAVLADSGLCPLTKQPLRCEALIVLTHTNIERYRGLIRNAD